MSAAHSLCAFRGCPRSDIALINDKSGISKNLTSAQPWPPVPAASLATPATFMARDQLGALQAICYCGDPVRVQPGARHRQDHAPGACHRPGRAGALLDHARTAITAEADQRLSNCRSTWCYDHAHRWV